MSIEILNRAVVMIGTGINPAQFTERWLISKKILTDSELDAVPTGDNVLVPVLTKIESQHFQVLVMPDKVQLSFRPGSSDSLVRDRCEKFAEAAQDIPFSATGLNFAYKVTVPTNKKFDEFTRRLFLPNRSTFGKMIDGSTPTACGSVVMRMELGALLKIEVRPALSTDMSKLTFEFLVADFNFHFQLDPGKPRKDQAVKSLAKWTDASKRSKALTEALLG